jgi:phospholipid/cholesterol/gamma-HCH transport system substrate-binding protein
MPRTRSIAWAQLKVGLLGIVAAVMALVVIVAVGGQGGFFWERYPLRMHFLNAQGLKSGAVVRLAGKDVGTVTSVDFVGSMIEVQLEVSKKVRELITDESVGTVGSMSLLGESILDITAGRSGTPIPDGGLVPTTEMGALADLTKTAAASLEQASELIADARAGRGTLGKLITDDTLYREMEQFVASAASVVDKVNRGEGTAGKMLNDPEAWQALSASLDNLRSMTDRLNRGEGALGRFLNDEALGQSLATTASNLEQTTARLNRGEGTMGQLLTDRELYDRLNSLATRVDEVVTGLNAGRGTAGQLLRDAELYENMNRAVIELRDLVADVRKDPKKYLRISVSIF